MFRERWQALPQYLQFLSAASTPPLPWLQIWKTSLYWARSCACSAGIHPRPKDGQTDVTAKAAVSFQSGADSEQLTLTFDAANAAAYKASLAHFPETVTLTLPSTQEVSVLEEVNQARENSRFIKSVYVLGRADGASQVQIEFDVTADVAVEEYKDPGSIVVRLKEGEFVGQNVYSLRTLSMDQDALTKMQKDFPDAL